MVDLKIQLRELAATGEREIQDALSQEVFQAMIEGYEAFEAAGPLKLSLRVWTMTEGAFLTGHLSGSVKTTCGRCSLGMEIPLSFPVQTAFLPHPTWATEDEEVELTEDDLELVFYDADEILHIDEFVRESMLLELPSYPRCELDTEGRCPVHNMDPGAALKDQDDTRIDPWHQGLSALKKRFES